MKNIIITLALTLSTILLNAQPPHGPREKCNGHDKKEIRAQFRLQHQARKVAHLSKEMKLTEAEIAIFTPIYKAFCDSMKASRKKINHAKKSTELDSPSYELVIEIIENEANVQHNLRKNLHVELKKHFTAEQIYLYLEAENSFNRLVVRELDKHRISIDK